MAEATLEHRISVLEAAVRELQESMTTRPQPVSNWLDQVIGSMKDEPAFDDVLEYGRQIRKASLPPEDGSQ